MTLLSPLKSCTDSGKLLRCRKYWLESVGVQHHAFYPTALKGCRVLFSPMVFGWAVGRQEKVCPGCISETVRCGKLILGRDIG